jgi:WD40 repeat protein
MITGTIDANGIVQFSSDVQRQSASRADGALAGWRIEDFTAVFSTGSGYHVITTTINFSPNGLYQSVATQGTIRILSRKNGSLISTFRGGAARTSTPANFSPDSRAIAAWDGDSNRTTLWRVSDGVVLMQFPDAFQEEGVAGIRFSPDGTRMVTSGYFAFQDNGGSWQQFGVVRFWNVSDGALRHQFDQHTGIGVTSAIAWSSDAAQFIYGTYEGTTVATHTPSP